MFLKLKLFHGLSGATVAPLHAVVREKYLTNYQNHDKHRGDTRVTRLKLVFSMLRLLIKADGSWLLEETKSASGNAEANRNRTTKIHSHCLCLGKKYSLITSGIGKSSPPIVVILSISVIASST